MKKNSPNLWKDKWPVRKGECHKYDFGHALIYGAQGLTGATRLAAEACARVGAGLTTVIGGSKADIYRATLPAHIMVRDDSQWWDDRVKACLIGPGGVQKDAKITAVPTVLDADAIGLKGIHRYCILTPHDGEFDRFFGKAEDSSRLEKTMRQAKRSGCTIVLKGHNTIIADPDGQCAINEKAPSSLATAGTGDVLSGIITGLLAQGMTPFDAACAGVWIHTQAASLIGVGLVASDLEKKLAEILHKLFSE